MITSANNNAHLMLVLALFTLTLGLHAEIMSWISILVACGGLMRLALYFRMQKHAPSVRTLNLLAFLSILVLAYFSLGLGVLLGMVNLLVLACALKIMLLRTSRDYSQLVASLLFLTGCGFIFQQTIGHALLYLAVMLMLLVSMAFNICPSQHLGVQLRKIGVFTLQALPIAALLFVVFPKLGPLWQMPNAKSTKTGLSDVVSPGDIADLSQSSELAFRVSFTGNIPPPEQRYWRAIVLENFDGSTWKVAQQRAVLRRRAYQMGQEFTPRTNGPYYEYRVMAEATQQRWLYALDLATPGDAKSAKAIWQGRDYQLLSLQPLSSSFQYQVRSYPEVPLNQSNAEFDQAINLLVPESGNPRTREWISTLRQQHPDNRDFAVALLEYFDDGPFRYTLQPPLMPRDPVDAFLFDQQAGFCAHYASAMAFALRLAGIPARMVTGYQGGELREREYLSVYQYDAHAWVEAWLDESGWQRLDPTAVVAPDRIRLGLEEAIAHEGSFLADTPFALARLKSIAWLNEFRLMLADMDYLWSRWVLGFDAQSQQDMLKALLGELSAQKMALFGLTVVMTICALLALFFLPNWSRKRVSVADRYFRKAEALLAECHFPRASWQGPSDFANTLAEQAPADIATSFRRVANLYVAQQYRPPGRGQQRDQLSRMRLELAELKRATQRYLRQR